MTRTARHRAVLFDLFNTLVPGGTRAERDRVSHDMAGVLGVEQEALAELVRRTFDDRMRGRLGDLTETIRWLAAQLGGHSHEDAIDAAVDLRLAMTRRLHANTWALRTLAELGGAGLLRGLVSDCSAETPMIWTETPLAPYVDAVSFSCVTGHRKPEPEAYLIAVRKLGVKPEECLFVGDGGSRELTGAAELGMDVCRFRPEGAPVDSIDQDPLWRGPTLTDLQEVIAVATRVKGQ